MATWRNDNYTKKFKCKKNVNIWCKVIRESGFQCLQNTLELDIIVHNSSELLQGKKDNYFLCSMPQKPKGLFWSQGSTDLYSLKKDLGGALKWDLRGQF